MNNIEKEPSTELKMGREQKSDTTAQPHHVGTTSSTITNASRDGNILAETASVNHHSILHGDNSLELHTCSSNDHPSHSDKCWDGDTKSETSLHRHSKIDDDSPFLDHWSENQSELSPTKKVSRINYKKNAPSNPRYKCTDVANANSFQDSLDRGLTTKGEMNEYKRLYKPSSSTQEKRKLEEDSETGKQKAVGPPGFNLDTKRSEELPYADIYSEIHPGAIAIPGYCETSEITDKSHVENNPGAFPIQDRPFGERPSWGPFGQEVSECFTDFSASLSNTSVNVLIEAEVVDERILVEAKPDSWLRRNLWWLAASSVSILIAIVITFIIIYFTTPDSNLADVPTISPTTLQEGVEESVYKIIVEQLPQAAKDLSSELSPQYQALQWISTKKINDSPSSWYTNQRVLQQYALLTLFLTTAMDHDDTDLPSWSSSGGWMESINECDWYGVTCALDVPAVTALNLNGNNLIGSLPSEISLLSPSLLSLTASNNLLKGLLPENLGRLTKLTTLDLSMNSLSGRIPIELGEAGGLEYLNLSKNSLGSTIPIEMGMLTNLQYLDIGYNGLIGSIPSQMGTLENIEEMNFENNELSYALPKEIGFLSSLEKLRLGGNQLLGPLPPEIGSLRRLEIFDLSRNYVFANIPSSLWNEGGLPSLKHLDLSNNLLTGSLPRDFGGSWKKLTSLRLGGRNFLRGAITENSSRFSFLYLPLLEELDLSSNYFTGTLPQSLFEASTLKNLDLSNNEFTGTVSSKLYDLHKLQVFDMSGNTGLEGTVSSFIGKLSNLKTLSLSGMSGPIPNELWSLTELEHLRLMDSGLSGTLPPELGRLTLLTGMILERNSLLEGMIPPEIGSLQLEKLILSGNKLMSGVIPTELGSLPLTSIFISENSSLKGPIPSELGSLPLSSMLISDNASLQGPIPSEFGLMNKLTTLDLGANKLSGTISSFLGNLVSLKTLRFFSNRLNGTVPTVLGALTNLEKIDLGANILTGTIPSEVGSLVHAKYLSLRFNQLTGTIPPELGNLRKLDYLNLWSLTVGGSLPSELCMLDPQPAILLDCAEVVCTCCGCPEYNPSNTPTASPFPTITPSPSRVHSSIPSYQPTSSHAPSTPSTMHFEDYSCFPFTPISSSGNLLTSYDEEGEKLVTLPFSFDFNNEGKNYTTMMVGQSGRIRMGNDSKSCFSAAIIAARSFTIQHGKDFSGPIYTLYMNDSFVISWEGVIPLGGSEGNHVVNFQVVLYANGKIEFRWGDGTYPVTHRPLATIANTCTQTYANPSGYPFVVPYGPVMFPEYGEWPENQCRLFEPNKTLSFYNEVEP